MPVFSNKFSRALQHYSVLLLAGCVISPALVVAKTTPSAETTSTVSDDGSQQGAATSTRHGSQRDGLEARQNESINVSAGRYLLKDPNRRLMTPNDWKMVLPGSNPLYMLQYTEGASLSGTDPFGVDLTTAGLYLRGFHMNELGVTYEGIPLNDIGWGGLTGTNVLNIGIAQDLGGISVSPGSGSVSTFSASNNGGDLHYFVRNPKDKAGLSVWQSYGSNQTVQTTVSADTGQIGAHGPKALFGFQRNYNDKYMGYGGQQMMRGHMKVVQDVSWGDFTAYFSGSTSRVTEYNDHSFAILDQLGWRNDYVAPNYASYYNLLLQDPGADCGNGMTCGDYASLLSYNSGHTTQDFVGSFAHDFKISKILSGRASFYMTSSDTNEVLTDPGTTSPLTGAPFAQKVWNPTNQRLGGTMSLRAKLGDHTVSIGFWQEHSVANGSTAYYNEPALGAGNPLSVFDHFNQYGPAFNRDTSHWTSWQRQAYLQDDWAITKNLHVSAGFKTLETSTTGGGVTGDAPRGTLSTRNFFLPHVTASYRYLPKHDVFVDIANNESGYRVSPQGQIGYTASPWTAANQEAFDFATKNIKPENDWNFIVGGHDRFGKVLISWDAYYDMIANRLLSASYAENGNLANLVNTVATVPHSHIVGGDIAFHLPITSFLTLHQTLGVSKFMYDNNISIPGFDAPIKGAAQPGYPPITLSTMLVYSRHGTEVGIGSTFYSRRPFSYTNDMYAQAYWMTNAYIQHIFKMGRGLPPVTARFDVYNLLNRKLMGTLGTNGFPFNRDTGYDLGTMQRQAPRQAMFTLGVNF